MSEAAPPGWYDAGDGREGYWDGKQWREFREPESAAPSAIRDKANDVAARVTAEDADFPAGTVWSAVGKPITGIGAGRYWIDEYHLFYEKGTLSTDSQQFPLHQVIDVDVKQTMTQKARGVFLVVVSIQGPAGIEIVHMQDIPDGRGAQQIINQAVHEARQRLLQAQNTRRYDSATSTSTTATGAGAANASAADPMEQLRQLGQLRDAGILTEDEFTTKKAEILSRL